MVKPLKDSHTWAKLATKTNRTFWQRLETRSVAEFAERYPGVVNTTRR